MSNAISEASGDPIRPEHFIRQIIRGDIAAGRHPRGIHTRFPPEPNGHLHIGHAKAICLNFGIAAEFGGSCNLRFDDTNPETENEDYARSIADDIRWLGFDWGDRSFHASDYFDELYRYAELLITEGKAYVDSLTGEQIREFRGTLTEPGRDSPYRNRDVTENLDLFRRMRSGEFPDGSHVLRAKIDMASPNVNLRDPVLYRIKHARHHRSGDRWVIYPMYDYTHCISDALEGITHSLCTLEFEDHRPLYDWVLEQLPVPCRPRQIEFARLNLDYTLTSKRKLLELVSGGHVDGWDDPRLLTLKGARRRGIPPSAIRELCERIGITKKDTVIDLAVLENCVREELDRIAPRALAVLEPLRVVIENYPADETEILSAANHPKDPSLGSREIPFSREILIERDDFRADPPRDFFRLAPGREVRLRYAYLIKCHDVRYDAASGEPIELRCTYDPASRGGVSPDGRKVKSTIHWVDARQGVAAEVRLYEPLFDTPNPAAAENFLEHVNPESKQVLRQCMIEPALARAVPEQRFQFERLGYFSADQHDHSNDRPVFNRIVTLRDSRPRS